MFSPAKRCMRVHLLARQPSHGRPVGASGGVHAVQVLSTAGAKRLNGADGGVVGTRKSAIDLYCGSMQEDKSTAQQQGYGERTASVGAPEGRSRKMHRIAGCGHLLQSGAQALAPRILCLLNLCLHHRRRRRREHCCRGPCRGGAGCGACCGRGDPEHS